MITSKQLAAVFGFAFVAMWVATNLGYAVLCLIGAAVFYLGAGVVDGELDLGELQGRLRRSSSGTPTYARPPAAPHRSSIQ